MTAKSHAAVIVLKTSLARKKSHYHVWMNFPLSFMSLLAFASFKHLPSTVQTLLLLNTQSVAVYTLKLVGSCWGSHSFSKVGVLGPSVPCNWGSFLLFEALDWYKSFFFFQSFFVYFLKDCPMSFVLIITFLAD